MAGGYRIERDTAYGRGGSVCCRTSFWVRGV